MSQWVQLLKILNIPIIKYKYMHEINILLIFIDSKKHFALSCNLLVPLTRAVQVCCYMAKKTFYINLSIYD